MPHAYRLSKKFSDTFGEEIADEFVNWFNQVDSTYRSDLHEQNERNWQRFQDALDKRTAELRADLAHMRTELAAFKAELIKWMFLFWAGTMALNVALIRLIS